MYGRLFKLLRESVANKDMLHICDDDTNRRSPNSSAAAFCRPVVQLPCQ